MAQPCENVLTLNSVGAMVLSTPCRLPPLSYFNFFSLSNWKRYFVQEAKSKTTCLFLLRLFHMFRPAAILFWYWKKKLHFVFAHFSLFCLSEKPVVRLLSLPAVYFFTLSQIWHNTWSGEPPFCLLIEAKTTIFFILLLFHVFPPAAILFFNRCKDDMSTYQL